MDSNSDAHPRESIAITTAMRNEPSARAAELRRRQPYNTVLVEDESGPEDQTRRAGIAPILDGIADTTSREQDPDNDERREGSSGAAKPATADEPAPGKDDIASTEPATNAFFECNICFDSASDPVLTLCGHLFCWPCLHTWFESQPHTLLCPLCKAGCGRDKVIPIYGRGSDAVDPRTKEIPQRPRGQRPEPAVRMPWGNAFMPFGMAGGGAIQRGRGLVFGGGNVHFAVGGGMGFMPPFWGMPNNAGGQAGAADANQAFLSRLFTMAGFLVMIAVLFY